MREMKCWQVVAIALGVLGAQCASAGVSDNLFIRGLTWDGRVVDIDIDTGHATQIAFGSEFRSNSLTMAPNGSLVFLSRADNRTLSTLSADGTSVIASRSLDRTIDSRGLATDLDGDLVALGPHPTEFGAGLWRIDTPSLSVTDPIRVTRANGAAFGIFQSADFSPSGELFGWFSTGSQSGADGLVRIDPKTGVGTAVTPATIFGVNFQSIAFAPDGRLFAVTANIPLDSIADSYSLYEIDPKKGTIDIIGAFGSDFDVRGIAVIPTPGGLGVIGVGLALAIRRRH